MVHTRDIVELVDIMRTCKVLLVNPNLLDKHYKKKLLARMDRILTQFEKDNERNKDGQS